MVIQTIQKPQKNYTEANGDTKFIRKVNGCKVHVVCKPLPEEDKWLVKSTWVRGEDDCGNKTRYKSYRGSSKNQQLGLLDILFNPVTIIAIFIVLYLIANGEIVLW